MVGVVARGHPHLPADSVSVGSSWLVINRISPLLWADSLSLPYQFTCYHSITSCFITIRMWAATQTFVWTTGRPMYTRTHTHTSPLMNYSMRLYSSVWSDVVGMTVPTYISSTRVRAHIIGAARHRQHSVTIITTTACLLSLCLHRWWLQTKRLLRWT